MSELLRVRGLSKSFQSGNQRLQVLRDLDLSLERGSIAAVTGPSGCGKSTFLHIVGGMDQPDAGEILFEGRDVARLQRDERARFRNREVGFVFQSHHLLPEFTARENVMMPLLLRRAAASRSAAVADELLRRVGLSGREGHRPGELSGGEQQRVAIARALAGSPKLLLADEPTGNLDQTTSREILGLLLEVQKENGLTAVMVTHNLELASLCQRHLVMESGRLVG